MLEFFSSWGFKKGRIVHTECCVDQSPQTEGKKSLSRIEGVVIVSDAHARRCEICAFKVNNV